MRIIWRNNIPFRIPADSTPPLVGLITLKTGGTVTAGERKTIRWRAPDNEEVSKINLNYSTNRGRSWATIVRNLSNTSSYDWEVPETASKNCLLKVKAVAKKGNSANDQSRNPFTIRGVPPTVKIFSPRDGETFNTGETPQVTWRAENNVVIDNERNNQ